MWRADSLFDFIVKMVPNLLQLSSLLPCSQSSLHAGMLKTHRLSLDIPEDDISPNVPSTAPTSTSRIVAGSLVIKDLLEHFGGFRKNDPSLQWEFGAIDVKVKTVVAGTKATGALQCYNAARTRITLLIKPTTPLNSLERCRDCERNFS